jgi:hypothetical protein
MTARRYRDSKCHENTAHIDMRVQAAYMMGIHGK